MVPANNLTKGIAIIGTTSALGFAIGAILDTFPVEIAYINASEINQIGFNPQEYLPFTIVRTTFDDCLIKKIDCYLDLPDEWLYIPIKDTAPVDRYHVYPKKQTRKGYFKLARVRRYPTGFN